MSLEQLADTLKEAPFWQTQFSSDFSFSESLKVFFFALVVIDMVFKILAWHSHGAFYPQPLDWIHDIDTPAEDDDNPLRQHKHHKLLSLGVLLKKSEYQPRPNDDSQNNTCPICLVDFESGEEICHGNNCAHLFHESCVKVWLAKTSSCPCCRQSMQKPAIALSPLLSAKHSNHDSCAQNMVEVS